LDRFTQALYLIPVAVISLSVHEFSHAFAANQLGDPTAKNAGRMTLNPLAHIDWIGILFLVLFRFGWAKPVPINIANFKHQKRDTSLVSLAGPFSNVLMALLGLLIFRFTYLYLNDVLFTFLQLFILVNIGLAIFNLLPVSPLDGSKIYISLLPDKYYYTILRYERYGYFVLLVLIATGLLDKPIGFLANNLFQILSTIAFVGM
jgi:Zn-dependent protease